MTWVRSEDSMPLHPKILRLSDGAFRLWSNALHFANRGVTDGKIPKELVPSLNHHGRWSAKQLAGFVSELAESLWIDRGDHYEIHDYAHHQAEAMKDRVERKRELDRERQRRKREREEDSLRESLGMSRRDDPRDNEPESRRETSVPSRPVPISPSDEGETRAPETAKHTARFLDSLTPTADPIADLARRFSDARHAAGFGRWTWGRKNYGPDFERLQRIDAALRDETELGYDAALAAAFRGFFADEKARDAKCPLSWLANDVGGYVARGATRAVANTTADLEAEVTTAREAYQARLGEDGDRERKERLDKARAALARARSAA